MIKKLLWLIVPLLFFSCSAKTPVITSIDPKIGRMGEVITLNGSNFGSARNESYVTIAGIAPTSSSYYVWQDELIMVRVPELGESGLVYVHSNGRRSNAVLFSNSAVVPRPVEGEELGLQPRITSINPQAGAPGTLITISGNNFGISRESSLQSIGGVFFSWDYESGTFNPYVVREPEFIEVSEMEAGYDSWSAREIRIRLPDGAVSGNLEVRTPHGRSRPVFFDISGKPGHKNFKDKRSYTINYSVDIRVLDASRPNTLYLWIPKPITSSSQRNVSLVSRSAEPFIENHRGVSLFKLDNLGSGANQSISLSYRVEVYSVETGIRPASVRQETSALSAMHTQSTDLIPANNQRIRSAVSSIIGREQNPYLRARLLYDWFLNNIEITEAPSSANVITALEERKADSYTAALLYTAMARNAGIPCVPLAGVLIDRNSNTFRHYWTELWINNFGWLPVDPAMGSGSVTIETVSGQTQTAQQRANFYFGNTDNMRIAFSRGELVLSQMENRGRLVSHPQSYSIQNIWEEASGGLESYSSLWGDIIISGIYIQ
ncbi:MAG: IPT/TIG domain-containing protein [Treponema sp.]|nr:IPT/TIG domain-containing protein [Treponema sp.]